MQLALFLHAESNVLMSDAILCGSQHSSCYTVWCLMAALWGCADLGLCWQAPGAHLCAQPQGDRQDGALPEGGGAASNDQAGALHEAVTALLSTVTAARRMAFVLRATTGSMTGHLHALRLAPLLPRLAWVPHRSYPRATGPLEADGHVASRCAKSHPSTQYDGSPAGVSATSAGSSACLQDWPCLHIVVLRGHAWVWQEGHTIDM